MAFQLNFLVFVTVCLMAQSLAAAVKKVSPKEQIAAVYIKDSNTGELRFLGGGGFNTNNNLDAWITQKQDFLEQLRPAGTGTGTGTGPTVIVPTGTGATLTNTNTNIPTTTGIDTGTPTTGTAGGNLRRGNKRRRVNNRRRVNRRGGVRRGVKKGNKRPQVIVIRPKA